MSDAAASAPASSPMKVTKKTTKPKTASLHPPTLFMVKDAINNLGEKSGSSLSAIKTYIEKNYKGIEMSRIALRVRKCVAKGADEDKIFVRHNSKCVGAHGKFRLNTKDKDTKTKKTPAGKPKKVKKPAPAKKTAKADTKTKKTKSPAKKAAVSKTKKSKTPTKKAAVVAKPTKKTKSPAKKTKVATKPKKTAAKSKKPAKK